MLLLLVSNSFLLAVMDATFKSQSRNLHCLLFWRMVFSMRVAGIHLACAILCVRFDRFLTFSAFFMVPVVES